MLPLTPTPLRSSEAEVEEVDDIALFTLTQGGSEEWSEPVIGATVIKKGDFDGAFWIYSENDKKSDFDGVFWLYSENDHIVFPCIPDAVMFTNRTPDVAEVEMSLAWDDGRSRERRIQLEPFQTIVVTCEFRQMVLFTPVRQLICELIALAAMLILVGCKTTRTPSADLFPDVEIMECDEF